MQSKRESPERSATAAAMPAASGTPGKSGRPPNTAYLALMKPDEDWREIEDSTERRKIQNRLAQRAYRRSLRNRNKELESLKKQLGSFQESSSLSPGHHHHSRATSRSRSRSSSGGGASLRNLCPSPEATSSPSPPALSDFAAVSGPPAHAGMPSSLAAPEWPQDCGSSAAALHAMGPYGLPDFMYFDAYPPPPPTHDAVGSTTTTTMGFDLDGGGGGFEGLGMGAGDPSSSSSAAAAPAWLSPPASEEPDLPQQPQQPPPSAFLPAFGGGGGHAPATPPEAADYLTTTAAAAATATFPPFTAPDSLGLVYPHPQLPPPHHGAVLDPALFADAAAAAELPQLLQPTPPTPPPPSSLSSSSSTATTTTTLLDPQHASLLHMAVASGNVEVLRLILDRVPPALARRPDSDGCTPAQRAARAGRSDMLAVLDHHHHQPPHAATGTGTSHGDSSPGLGPGLDFPSMC